MGQDRTGEVGGGARPRIWRRGSAMRGGREGTVGQCSLAVLHMHRLPQPYALLRLHPVIYGRQYRIGALTRPPPSGAASSCSLWPRCSSSSLSLKYVPSSIWQGSLLLHTYWLLELDEDKRKCSAALGAVHFRFGNPRLSRNVQLLPFCCNFFWESLCCSSVPNAICEGTEELAVVKTIRQRHDKDTTCVVQKISSAFGKKWSVNLSDSQRNFMTSSTSASVGSRPCATIYQYCLHDLFTGHALFSLIRCSRITICLHPCYKPNDSTECLIE
jgi:hypothetical protein